jgi:hypothetical protein
MKISFNEQFFIQAISSSFKGMEKRDIGITNLNFLSLK